MIIAISTAANETRDKTMASCIVSLSIVFSVVDSSFGLVLCAPVPNHLVCYLVNLQNTHEQHVCGISN